MASTATLIENNLIESMEKIHGINLDNGSPYTVVDCDSALSDMIDILADLPVTPPSIYVDLEGVKLSRHGTISILQLYVLPKDYTYLVDVHQLQDAAFSTPGKHSGMCLKAIFEAGNIPKVFFDVRNDSDALFHHFQISLSGVHDIQLMEVAARKFNRRRVNGLQRCIENDAVMTTSERYAWNVAKEKGKKLFAPEQGGRYEVFNDRPMAKEIIQYCVQDVQFLPQLWSHYKCGLSAGWETKVREETKERVSSSQSKHYKSHGEHKAMAPTGWYTAPSRSNRRAMGQGIWHDNY